MRMPNTFDCTLYSHQGGPNGWKVAIILSELGIKYRTIFTDFQKGEHKKEAFLKICPNGRIPAIVDHANNNFAVWESGSIILYLVQRYDKNHRIWPKDVNSQTNVISWIMLQVSGQGVIQGQAFWFKFFHHERLSSATKRYIDESRRIYGVIEMRLTEARESIWDDELQETQIDDLREMAVWLVGTTCTIADLSFLTWTRAAHRLGIDIEAEFPEVHNWMTAMMKRQGVIRGLSPNVDG